MATTPTPSGIGNDIPILGWLPGYEPGWLRLDLAVVLLGRLSLLPCQPAGLDEPHFQAAQLPAAFPRPLQG